MVLRVFSSDRWRTSKEVKCDAKTPRSISVGKPSWITSVRNFLNADDIDSDSRTEEGTGETPLHTKFTTGRVGASDWKYLKLPAKVSSSGQAVGGRVISSGEVTYDSATISKVLM